VFVDVVFLDNRGHGSYLNVVVSMSNDKQTGQYGLRGVEVTLNKNKHTGMIF